MTTSGCWTTFSFVTEFHFFLSLFLNFNGKLSNVASWKNLGGRRSGLQSVPECRWAIHHIMSRQYLLLLSLSCAHELVTQLGKTRTKSERRKKMQERCTGMIEIWKKNLLLVPPRWHTSDASHLWHSWRANGKPMLVGSTRRITCDMFSSFGTCLWCWS